ncbi:MAG: T9SS type A sorting domain-containing protein [Saprospiraceae bacterium]|nr:T9SS type A sorting domain-containing protein [Saprospiraceae bacterium]
MTQISSVKPDAELTDRNYALANYKIYQFDYKYFADMTQNVKSRYSTNKKQHLIIEIPFPDGKTEKFTLMNAELMNSELAAKYPEVKAYCGKGISDPTASVRINYSPYTGFHAMILSGNHKTLYYETYTKDKSTVIAYFKNDIRGENNFNYECSLLNGIENPDAQYERVSIGDCNLRKYALAMSCTGEYATYHVNAAGLGGGTTAQKKAAVLAAMNVTMNRVNGIFERDFGITTEIISNNDQIIYLTAASDPWTGEWNTTTQTTIDNVIGSANYDIGHNFNSSGGGNAGCIGCVCVAGSKGSGYTGSTSPVGDAFDVDYVAHEMGHQFGAFHSMSSNNCRSGDDSSEVEPGSGSTIMSYAGICATNVQNQVDDYFNYYSILTVVNYTNGSTGNGCATIVQSGNSEPTANAGSNYSIPVSTPFKLNGIATDANDTGLTYCWEENDPENPNSSAAPTATRTVGPMFRSYDPVSVPYRYFPSLQNLVSNTTTWEVLPSVARSMDFSFTVRDNNASASCTEFDIATVTTVAGVGPFVVTAPNTNVTWNVGTSQTVTWNVANTTNSPVSCSNVDILLSTDGGLTYPITLLAGTPNDGSQAIIVPNNVTTQARVMVFCSSNIFFDISNTNFTIVSTVPEFTLTPSSSTLTSCGGQAATTNLAIASINNFSTPVQLSSSGVPTGAVLSFSSNPVTPSGTTTISINPGTAATGTYSVTVTAVGGTVTHTTVLTYTVATPNIAMPSLLTPTNGATGIANNGTLTWQSVTNATSYQIQLSLDANFTNIFQNHQNITTTTLGMSSLTPLTTYYWRVRGVNACGNSTWSTTYSFTTANLTPCTTFAGGVYDFGAVSCFPTCQTELSFGTTGQVYANEAYKVANVVAGAEYTFEFCENYNSSVWQANITVAYLDAAGTGAIAGSDFATTSGCSITFTAPTSGNIILIIWTSCGAAEIQTDNGIPTFACTGNGTVVQCPSSTTCIGYNDFETGQPSNWTFAGGWQFSTGTIGTAGANPGTGNWAFFDDDAAGNGQVNTATATSPTYNLAGMSDVTLSFDYNYIEYDSAPQEFVQLKIWNGSAWIYWNGTSWTTTSSNWLSTTSSLGYFSQVIPQSYLNSAFKVQIIYNDNSGWEWGFGFDNFALCPLPCTTPQAVITGTSTICNGAPTTLTASGGGTYSWSNNLGNNASISVSSAGTYTVTVTNNGCTSSTSVTVTQVSTNATITGNTNICSGGVTTLLASGGNSYQWNNNLGNNASVTVSNPGIYTVTITSNNCSSSTSVTVNQTAVQAAITGNLAYCEGSSGTLTVTGGGSYVWSNGSTSSTITTNAAGTYCVTVTTNGCTSSTCANVIISPAPSLTVSNNSPTIGQTLTISASSTSSNAYSWAGPNGFTSFDQNISILNATPNQNGTYCVTATSLTSSCTATACTLVNVTNGSVEICNNGIDDDGNGLIDCDDVSCSTIASITGNLNILSGSSSTLTASGGTQFIWSNVSTSQSIDVYTPGEYCVTVSNGNCTSSACVNVTVDCTGFSTLISGPSSFCNVTAATLSVNSSSSLLYSWSNLQTTPSIVVTSPGVYSVSVVNLNGCFATDDITITGNLQTNITGINNICEGETTQLIASNGAGFNWSTGETTQSISTTQPGQYCVTVSENGCTSSSCITVNVSPRPVVTATNNNPSLGQTMNLTSTATNAITYLWSGPNGFVSTVQNPSIQNATPNNNGVYCVVAFSSAGCSSSSCTTVNVNTNPVEICNNGIDDDGDGLIDCADSDCGTQVTIGGPTTAACPGSIITLLTNATNAQQYLWSNGSTSTSTTVTSGGNYCVTTTSPSGCTSSACFVVTYTQLPEIQAAVVNPSGGFSNGTITIASNNTYVTYLWSNGSTAMAIGNLPVGTYCVTATTNTGCVKVRCFDLVNQSCVPVWSYNITTNCVTSCINFTGDATNTYTMSNGVVSNQVCNLTTGVYSVTVTNNLGCVTTGNIQVIVPTPISVTLNITNESVQGASDGSIQVNITGGTAPYQVNCFNDCNNLPAGNYPINITDANGCTFSTNAEVTTTVSNEELLLDNLTILPNPANDYVSITSSKIEILNSIKDILLYDVIGRNLNVELNKLNGMINVNTANLPNGTYILQIRTADTISSAKVILQH